MVVPARVIGRHGCPGPRDWLGTSRRVDITAGIPIPAVNLANERNRSSRSEGP